jgi:hypothetical protein
MGKRKGQAIVNNVGARQARRQAAEARRDAEAAAEAANATKIQAEMIAKRASMARTHIVIVRFAGGAHDVKMHDVTAPLPVGYSEARVSLRERWNTPALRFTDAERLADTLRASLDRARRERGDAARIVRRA